MDALEHSRCHHRRALDGQLRRPGDRRARAAARVPAGVAGIRAHGARTRDSRHLQKEVEALSDPVDAASCATFNTAPSRSRCRNRSWMRRSPTAGACRRRSGEALINGMIDFEPAASRPQVRTAGDRRDATRCSRCQRDKSAAGCTVSVGRAYCSLLRRCGPRAVHWERPEALRQGAASVVVTLK